MRPVDLVQLADAGDIAGTQPSTSMVEQRVDRTSLRGRVYAIAAGDAPVHPVTGVDMAYRCLEVVLAAAGLLLGLPLMLALAVMVRLDSPGPALFIQRRVARSRRVLGRDLEGREDLCPPPGGYDPDAYYYVPSYFRMMKFRTMYSDARTRFPEYYRHDYAESDFRGRFATLQKDPRVTRVGRTLRKLSVDELPNLWSVLTGHMRLVGPRPEEPEVLKYYSAEEMRKFTCKPGVTGLAQVSGRGLLDYGQTLALDLEYVRNRSVALDLKIILYTIKQVLRRHGAF